MMIQPSEHDILYCVAYEMPDEFSVSVENIGKAASLESSENMRPQVFCIWICIGGEGVFSQASRKL